MNLMKDTNIHFENKYVSRWFFVFLCIMYSMVYMTKNCFNSALASIVAEGVLTKSQTGLMTASFYLVYTPLQILGGIFADRYNPERMIKIGLIGSGITNLFIFFCHNYYVMLASWVFSAIIQFPLWPSVFKIISSQLCRSDRPQMIFYMSFTSSLGLIFGYIVAAIIPSWEYNFAFSSAILFAFAILLHIICKKINCYVKPDAILKEPTNDKTEVKKIDKNIFLISGFYLIVVAVFFRSMVEQGIKTLSATMLMESYDYITPSTGNILNVFIIISGVIGAIIMKTVLYPRFIKNEVKGMMAMLLASLPFCVALGFMKNLHAYVVIVILCIISILFTGTHLLTSYFNMYFVKWGKNGTAAGIINSASSFGIVLQSYGFLYIVELFNWLTVINIWVIMVAITVIFIGISLPKADSFKKNYIDKE